MNNIFDKVFCLNLDTRKDRWDLFQQEAEKHNIVAERISGIQGSKLNVRFSHISNGAVGCALSQLFIFKMAKQMNLQNFLLLEDDCEFHPDFNNLFMKIYSQVPEDWDALYLGGNHLSGQLAKVTENIYRVGHSFAAHAVAFRSSVFDLFIEKLTDITKPCDVHYVEAQPYIKAYGFFPTLAWQRESYSDIENKNVNYTYLKVDIKNN